MSLLSNVLSLLQEKGDSQFGFTLLLVLQTGKTMQELTKVFKALSDGNRLKIFTLLLEGTLCVKALVNCLDISQPAISAHLRVLREADLIKAEKRGYWVHYSANQEKAQQVVKRFNSLLRGEKYVQNNK